MDWMLAHPEERAAMGRAARQAYEAQFTPEANYAMLMDIYRQAMAAS
jgi:glycosyltransferase involved in cell wall biosynthesis